MRTSEKILSHIYTPSVYEFFLTSAKFQSIDIEYILAA